MANMECHMNKTQKFSFGDDSVASGYENGLVPILFEPWAIRLVEDGEEAFAVLRTFLRDGDVVLVKASHALGLETLAVRLVEEAKA